MSLSIVHTRAALGVNAPPITVEVHISKGLPGLTMVGLPETTAAAPVPLTSSQCIVNCDGRRWRNSRAR